MVVVVSGVSVWYNVTVCTHKILGGGGGGGLFGQVKSVIKKIFLLRCNITGCTHKILAGGGSFWSSQICNKKKNFY